MFDTKTICIFQLSRKLQNIKNLHADILTVTSNIKTILLVTSRHSDILNLLPVT